MVEHPNDRMNALVNHWLGGSTRLNAEDLKEEQRWFAHQCLYRVIHRAYNGNASAILLLDRLGVVPLPRKGKASKP